MDRITESLLQEFSAENILEKLSEERRFEHFASYVTVRRHFSQTFDTFDIVTGGGADTGIDAIAIIVNGSLVTDVDSFEEVAQGAENLDVTFIFVQAERSSSFEASKIGTFHFGVQDFFKVHPSMPRNEQVANAATIMSSIYDRSSKFKRGNPACRMFYVTTGKWLGDPVLESRRQAAIVDCRAPANLTKWTLGAWEQTPFKSYTTRPRTPLLGSSRLLIAWIFPKCLALPRHTLAFSRFPVPHFGT
jgi:hypothetical protein